MLNAKAVINAERAWIDGELVRDLSENDPGWLDMTICEYGLQITNHGRTPAYILSWKSGFGCLPLAVSDFPRGTLSHETAKSINFFLPPNHGKPLELCKFDLVYEISDWPAVLAGTKTGVLEITIEYFDILVGREEPRETYFVYSYSTRDARLNRLHWKNGYK
jgi:hypothetical protein